MKKIVLIFIISFLFTNKLPNDVRWTVESKEYEAICYQIYKIAENKLDKHFSKNKHSLNIGDNSNLAIIMDLDETVLDNSQYQVELFENNESFNMGSWASWVRREEAKLVPGSKGFIDKVRSMNIQLIFISNRMDERVHETMSNMRKLDVHSDNDIYLLRKNREDRKHVRRNEIYNSTGRMAKYKTFKVIQYLGDAMGDFPNSDLSNFSNSQFIFPNSMYGKW